MKINIILFVVVIIVSMAVGAGTISLLPPRKKEKETE